MSLSVNPGLRQLQMRRCGRILDLQTRQIGRPGSRILQSEGAEYQGSAGATSVHAAVRAGLVKQPLASDTADRRLLLDTRWAVGRRVFSAVCGVGRTSSAACSDGYVVVPPEWAL